jgi:DNA-binding XRE family transcriptional regulator
MTSGWSRWEDVKAARAASDARSDLERATDRAAAAEVLDSYIAGYRLAELRREAAVSQAELAARLGVSQARISAIENGEVGRMEVDTIRGFVEALGGTVNLTATLGEHTVKVA